MLSVNSFHGFWIKTNKVSVDYSSLNKGSEFVLHLCRYFDFLCYYVVGNIASSPPKSPQINVSYQRGKIAKEKNYTHLTFSPQADNNNIELSTTLLLPWTCFSVFRHPSLSNNEKNVHTSFPFSVAATRFFLFVVDSLKFNFSQRKIIRIYHLSLHFLTWLHQVY